MPFAGKTRSEVAAQIVDYLHGHPGYLIGKTQSYRGLENDGSEFFVRVVQFLTK